MEKPPNRASRTAPSTGFKSWTKERKTYLAVGVLACLAGILIIVFSRGALA